MVENQIDQSQMSCTGVHVEAVSNILSYQINLGEIGDEVSVGKYLFNCVASCYVFTMYVHMDRN